MPQSSSNNFTEGIVLDVDQLRVPPNYAVFIKNLTDSVNTNSSAPALSGSNAKVRTPMEGNMTLAVSGMPSGTNTCIGFYDSSQTNEGYFALYNSNSNHSIWVIDGDNGVVSKVYEGSLLPFVLNPSYFLAEGRMTLELQAVIDPVTNLETNFKFLIFTNNNAYQCVLDVTASTATSSYSTPYFTNSSSFYNPLELIHLGSVLPLRPMSGTTIPIGINNPNAYIPVTGTGIIDTATKGASGSLYTVGSTFSISSSTGGTGGTGQVTAIGSGGSVVSFIITNGGGAYSITTSPAATTTTGGGGSGLTLNIITLVIPDGSKQNLIINSGWQFRYQTIDVWGRFSNWSIISSVATVLTGGGCVGTSNGLPRCFNLCFDAGNPLIKYITIAYRQGVGNDPTGQTETGWLTCETFSKYDDSQSVEWYQRPYNPTFITANSGIIFNSSTNVITYTFCADKQSAPVDSTEAAYTEPGLPISSSSVFSVNKAIALANNVYDFEPIAQSVIDSLQFSAARPSPSQTPCDAAPLRTITVYAAIWGPLNGDRGIIRTSFGKIVWGNGDGDCGDQLSSYGLDQVFGDQTAGNSGFIGYIAGTNIKCISTQGYINPSTGVFTYQGYGSGISFPTGGGAIQQFVFTGVPAGIFSIRLASHKTTIADSNLQQTSTYVGGICPIVNLTPSIWSLGAYAEQPIKEIIVDCEAADRNLNGFSGLYGGAGTDPIFVILDLTNGGIAIDGYLNEQNGSSTPIEMQPVAFGGTRLVTSADTFGSFFTDHNGFFFASTKGTLSILNIQFYSDFCDGQGINQKQIYGSSNAVYTALERTVAGITHGDSTDAAPCSGVTGNNWMQKIYFFPTTGNFPAAARRRIIQPIYICGSTSSEGAPGIPVVMTKGAIASTDGSGNATIIAHNRYNYASSIGSNPLPYLGYLLPNYGTNPGNEDLLIFSQNGGCQWNVCGSCTTSLENVTVIYLACGASSSGCTTTQPPRTLCLSPLQVQPNGVGISGITSGGKYPTAVWFADIIGRHTDPQTRAGDNGYVSVPNLNDGMGTNGTILSPNPFAPYPVMALCSLQLTIPTGLIVPNNFSYLNVLIGSNVLFSDFFSWQADWVQYVDNTGATNTASPTSIRIYLQSLNEYNKQYNQTTNVSWDYITEITEALNGTQAFPVDVVQFILNGNGTYLAPIKGSPITYDQYGSFFTIDYVPELAGLTNGCSFRIIRPNKNTSATAMPYYEQCLTIPITNGVIQAGTYTIPYQDSYLLSRSIPVPLLQGQPNAIPPGGLPPNALVYTSTNTSMALATSGFATNNLPNNNNVLVFQPIDAQTNFPFFFESPSPSDLWGSHLASKGRVGIPNPYQRQYRIGTEIAVSNPVALEGIYNGMSTFLDANKETFDRNTWGDITVVLVETSVCLVICDRDHFVIRYNGNQVEVVNGTLQAQNQYGIFTAPERKSGTNYGCSMFDINTIRKYAGIVRWLDTSGYIVIHNFSEADSNTDKAGYLGYILNKIGVVNIKNLTPNSNGITYWMGGIDPQKYEYNLTTFNIPITGNASYINTQSQPDLAVNETLIFDLTTSRLKSFASYTPEYYGLIPSFYYQRQFLSFKQGIPYIHHYNLANNASPAPYCNFYGVQCEVRITHVVNGIDGKMLPDKVKRFLYTEIYCRQAIPGGSGMLPTALWYADAIISEKNQVSRLLPTRFDLKDGYACAAFLCDLNTPNDPNQAATEQTYPIIDGNPLQGRWIQVSLTNASGWTGFYFELSEVLSYINGLEKSGD